MVSQEFTSQLETALGRLGNTFRRPASRLESASKRLENTAKLLRAQAIGGAGAGATGQVPGIGRLTRGLTGLTRAAGPVGVVLGAVTTAVTTLGIAALRAGRRLRGLQDTSTLTGVSYETLTRSTRGLLLTTTDLSQAQSVALSAANSYRNVIDSFQDPLRAGTEAMQNFLTRGVGSVGIGLREFEQTGGDVIKVADLVNRRLAEGLDTDTLRRALVSTFGPEVSAEILQLATNTELLRKAQEEAAKGPVLSDRARDALDKFVQSWDKLNTQLGNTFLPLLEAITPLLVKVTDNVWRVEGAVRETTATARVLGSVFMTVWDGVVVGIAYATRAIISSTRTVIEAVNRIPGADRVLGGNIEAALGHLRRQEAELTVDIDTRLGRLRMNTAAIAEFQQGAAFESARPGPEEDAAVAGDRQTPVGEVPGTRSPVGPQRLPREAGAVASSQAPFRLTPESTQVNITNNVPITQTTSPEEVFRILEESNARQVARLAH